MSQLRSHSSSPFNDEDSDIACFNNNNDNKKFTFNSMSDLSGVEDDTTNSYAKLNHRLNLNSTMKKKKKKKETKKLTKTKQHLINNNENEYGTCLCCLLHKKYYEKNIEHNQIGLKKKLKPDQLKTKVLSTSLPLTNLSKPIETEYIEKINKLCSSIVDLNIQNKEALSDVANNLTHTDFLIDSQMNFFTQISQAINSFISINSYLIFEFNNNQNLETNFCLNSLDRFEKFEEFLKVSSPLTNWLKKYDRVESFIQSEKMSSRKNLLIDNTDYHEHLETKLNDLKKQLDTSSSLRSEDMDIEVDPSYHTMSESLQDRSTTNNYDEYVKIYKYENICKQCKKLEQTNEVLLKEIFELRRKIKANSKEYKIIPRSEYEALKLQIKTFRQDYKAEFNEKTHFQRKNLLNEEKLAALSNSSKLNTLNNRKLIEMIDF